MQAANLEELSENHNFSAIYRETALSFKLRELRWHGKLKRKRRPEVEVELHRKAASLFPHDRPIRRERVC